MPLRAVFDNATEVGRRVGADSTSALFRRFAAHYGLDYSFTNPYSGNEKAPWRNKVGALRRNLFVPMPQIWGREGVQRAAARRLPLPSPRAKPHYRKGRAGSGLFGDDRAALSPLPRRRSRGQVDRGSATAGNSLQGRRRAPPYSAGPANASREVAVAMGAFDVTGSSAPGGGGGGGVRPRMGRGADGLGRPRAPAEGCSPCGRAVTRQRRPGSLAADELVAFLDSEAPPDLGGPTSRSALGDVSALERTRR